MSDIIVTYEGGLRCHSRHRGSGTVVVTNAPRENHGTGQSFSPSDLLGVSLGSCLLSSMGLVARSIKLDLSGATATIRKQMANAPRRITSISVTIHVPHPLTKDEARQLEAAVHACPVHAVLKPEVQGPIVFTWGVQSDPTPEPSAMRAS